MNQLVSLKAEINKIQRSVNLLLSQRVQQQTQNIPDELLTKITRIIGIFDKLAENGVSEEEFYEQFTYTADIVAFRQIRNQLLDSFIDPNTFGIHPNLFHFSYDGIKRLYKTYQDKILFLDAEITEANLFTSGYIILTGRPNLMISNNNNYLLTTKNEKYSWNLQLDSDNNAYKLIINNVDQNQNSNLIIVTIPYDEVQGGDLRYIPDYTFQILQYDKLNNEICLRGLYININITTSMVQINEGPIVLMPIIEFQNLISELPSGINLIGKAFVANVGQEATLIRNKLLWNRIETLENGLIREFNNSFDTQNINGLYGQGAAVGITQLYDSLQSTVRQEDLEYNKSSLSNVSHLINNSTINLPSMGSLINQVLRNKIDIYGNAFTLAVSQRLILPPSATITLLSAEKLKTADYLPIDNYRETAGQLNTGFNIGLWRSSQQKTIINQISSTGNIIQCMAWFEADYTTLTPKAANSGDFILTDQNEIYKATVVPFPSDNLFDKTIKNLGLCCSSSIPLDRQLKYINGHKLDYTAVRSLVMHILIPNGSSEGAITATADISYTITVNNIPQQINTTLPITKNKILYGSGEAVVYTAVITSQNVDVSYLVGATISLNQRTVQNVYTYTSYTNDQKPTSPITVASSSYSGLGTTQADVCTCIYDSDEKKVMSGDSPDFQGLAKYRYGYVNNNSIISNDNKFFQRIYPFYRPGITDLDGVYRLASSSYLLELGQGPIMNITQLATTELRINYERNTITSTAYPSTSIGFSPTRIDIGSSSVTNQQIVSFMDYNSVNFEFGGFDNMSYSVNYISDSIQTTIRLNNFDLSVTDIILPDRSVQQIALSENIIGLRDSVDLLRYYSAYIDVLLDNYDARFNQIENTLSQVITTLNDIIDVLTPKNQSPASGIISFIGTGIGMFFPLVGLGVSVIGQLVDGLGKISNGDVQAGATDIVFGGVMSVLGLYKYNQRLKRKYGQKELDVYDDSDLVNSNNLNIKPGYGIKRGNTTSWDRSGPRTNTNGMMYNSSYNVDIPPPSYEVATRISKQTPLYNIPSWARNGDVTSYDGIFCSPLIIQRALDLLRIDFPSQYELIARTEIGFYNGGDDFTYQELTNEEMQSVLDINVSSKAYALVCYLYAQSNVQPYSENIGFDEDTFSCMLMSNGISTNNYMILNSDSVKNNTAKLSKKKKWKIVLNGEKSKNLSTLENAVPIRLSLGGIDAALNPYAQSGDYQLELYDNLINFLNSGS